MQSQAKKPFFYIIAVIINMFRLPDLLTGENVMCNILKLL